MLGAIAGDIIGSVYEFTNVKPEYDFKLLQKHSHFTANTILTIALAESILNNDSYQDTLKKYFLLYPNLSYGGYFFGWLLSPKPQPYESYGSGSAMRVSSIGWSYKSLEVVLEKAKESAEITHNHIEGIKGAQATASAVYLARNGESKKEIKKFIEKKFKYDLNFSIKGLRKNYKFEESCQMTVPQAIFTFLQSMDFEDSIRLAIYIGGDSDTLACINGSIAEAFYRDIPQKINNGVNTILDTRLKKIVYRFCEQYQHK